MPPISQLINSPEKDRKWDTVEPLSNLMPHPMPTPVADPYKPTPGLRCTLPPTNTVNPDNLRQLDQPAVRVTRVTPPKFPVS